MKSLLTQQHIGLRWRISVSGTVQGVGFRPFIYGLARRFGVAGWVCNTSDGVRIEVEGAAETLRQLLDRVARGDSRRWRTSPKSRWKNCRAAGFSEFEIRHSQALGGGEYLGAAGYCRLRGMRARIFPRRAIAATGIRSPTAPIAGRASPSFAPCLMIGPPPPWRISPCAPPARRNMPIRAIGAFMPSPMPARNAGRICCWMRRAGDDADCLARAAALLQDGKILAIKGLGGYHLACDARNQQAVQALRARKGRAGKPFAVMCADLAEARRICEVDAAAEALLLAPERPIVLMPANAGGRHCARALPHGTSSLGVMLPYTPLHQLLLAQSPPTLVMTSGNLSEEPIVHRDEEARERLGAIADHHAHA